MPKDTFFKLSDEKKEKIIEAGKKEFARAGIKDSSIQKIIEEANIPRGSFYQYFENKEDLLQYLLKEHAEEMEKNLENTIKRTNGDIFAVFISIYNYMVKEGIEKSETNFIKRIIEEVKTSQDNIFYIDMKKHKPKGPEEYYDLINKESLRINNIEDFKLLTRMLHSITKKAVVYTLDSESKKKAKEDFLKQIEYIKYGVIKGGRNV